MLVASNEGAKESVMFPFSEIARPSVLYISRGFEEFQNTIRDATRDGVYIPSIGGDAETGVSEADMAHFYVLARTLELLRGIADADFHKKSFYDVSGSCGRTCLTAALLYDWEKVESIEATSSNEHQGHALLGRMNRHHIDVNVVLNNFMDYEWGDCDVCFFDSTIFCEFIDEGILIQKFEYSAMGMEAGSFLILITHSKKKLFGTDFRIVHKDETRQITDSKTVVVWTLEKKTASLNRAARRDLEKGREAAMKLEAGVE